MDRSGSGMTASPWEGFRLSRQQEHLLGLTNSVPTDRIVARVDVAGPVDTGVLTPALGDVLAAHESLRTTYRNALGGRGSTLMVIEDDPGVRIASGSGGEAELRTLMEAEARTAPDDERPHAVRLTHFTLDGDGHSLVLSAPRLNMDEASVATFFRDLHAAYTARSAGQPWQSGDVVQYADYAQWQLDNSDADERQKQVAVERETRLRSLPALRLPWALQSSELTCEHVSWEVDPHVVDKLAGDGAERSRGVRGVLLTAWLVALWHATGRPEQVAVSAAVPRRPDGELRDSIGCFESPRAVIASLSAQTTVSELFAMVDRELAAAENADESALEPDRQHAVNLPGFRFCDLTDLPATGEFSYRHGLVQSADDGQKVSLTASATAGGLRLTLGHRSKAMADGGADVLVTCLRAVLSALGHDPTAAVGSLAMLDADAAARLVTETNAGYRPTSSAPWHRQFEAQAQRTPDGVAVRADGREWTFREFDEAAGRLANELVSRGVLPGSFVGLCLTRSDLAIIGMAAIAKAGAAYVPIDPVLPPRRRAVILDNVQATHALATAESAAQVSFQCDTVVLDPELTACRDNSATAPEVDVTAEHPAYVLFTSGSTGKPKGVVVTHGQLSSYLDGVLDRLGLAGPVDSVALGTIGTDLGHTSLFPPLVTGGRLVVASEEAADAQVLAEFLAAERCDLLKITPSHLAALVGVADKPEALMPRTALVLGGEPFSWGWWNLFRDFLGDCRLFNHYGPTETTVGVLCGEVMTNAAATLSATVPIGVPMRHARVYILDPERRPLPAGVAGELWIGGSSVAKGYLDGTAGAEQRFFDDPFDPAPGARMYRTGDKVRFLPDHGIEFLGRMDRQLKVRGFRVELGEIEAAMREHPRVNDALVVEVGESTAAHLVGYFIDAKGGRESGAWLRDHLVDRLPDFMIPTHFVALDSFPLKTSGKIDFAMLPEPGSYGQGESAYVEPRTPTERRVAEIVADLLLLRKVSADDDFFDIGGHSLLAPQLVVKLRDEFGLNIKLRNLFEWPVVSELATFVDEQLAARADGGV